MSYNGHKNYNHWNVSLWINSDEGLYREARYYTRLYTRADAADQMLSSLHCGGLAHTPDGVRYTKTTIRAAMADM